MASPRPWALLALCISLASQRPVAGQSHGIQFAADFLAGAVAPLRSLGTIGVAEGRLDAAPALRAALHARLPSGLFAAASYTAALTEGLSFRPTSACAVRCVAEDWSSGRVAFAALDVGYQHRAGKHAIALQAGPAVRRMAFGDLVCICEPEPNEFDVIPFVQSRTSLALHIGLQAGRHVGGSFAIIGYVDDYVSKPGVPRLQHDLTTGLGVRIGIGAASLP